jgi:hypothetical protein
VTPGGSPKPSGGAVRGAAVAAPRPPVEFPAGPQRSAAPAPIANEASVPASMQPSGPVPKIDAVAAGSGPHDPRPLAPPGPPVKSQLALPVDAEAALRAWHIVLDELEELRKVSLAALFRHARVMTWTADQLALGFPIDDHSMGDMANDRTDELTAIVRSLGPAQKNVRVAIRLLDSSESQTTGARSVLETTRERSSAERTKREAEARAHPITKHVLQTFGAQIKEIKTDV